MCWLREAWRLTAEGLSAGPFVAETPTAGLGAGRGARPRGRRTRSACSRRPRTAVLPGRSKQDVSFKGTGSLASTGSEFGIRMDE